MKKYETSLLSRTPAVFRLILGRKTYVTLIKIVSLLAITLISVMVSVGYQDSDPQRARVAATWKSCSEFATEFLLSLEISTKKEITNSLSMVQALSPTRGEENQNSSSENGRQN